MTATDPSGLQVTTTYYFKVNTVEYSILTGDPAPTFQEVADLMDTAVTGASFSVVIVGDAPNQDIRVINEGDRGWDSEIDLEYGTSGPNLWINLTGFTGFDPAVPGRGAFSIELESSVEAGGKAQTGGAAVYSFINEPPVGSMYLTGNVPVDSLDITGTQDAIITSIDLSGTSTYQIGYVWIAGGGLVQGDAASFGDIVYLDEVYMSSNPSSGLVVKTGGSALVEIELIATVLSGPAILGGTSPSFADKIYIPSGGAVASGAVAVDEFILTYAPSGSATFAGAGITTSTNEYVWLTSGGAVLGGAADTAQEFIYNGLWFGDAYYPFNERTGTTVNDSFGSNDITLSAGDLWTEDAKFTSAAQFDKNDWSTLGTDVAPLAVSFWHKRKTVDQDSFRVFGASADGLNWYFGYDLPFFRAMIRNNGTDYYFFNGTDYLLIPDDDEYHWYYIEFYSGSNAEVYVDNVYRGGTVNFFGTGGANQLHTIGNGDDVGPTGIYGFGPIDDLRIYTSYRLDSDQRIEIYERSPDPGGMTLGGAAQIQPVIVTGHEYLYTGKSGMQFAGQRYSYIGSDGATLAGASPVELEFSYTASGGIVLQSVSTFHDFGLGYIYDASGTTLSDGASLYEYTADYVYSPSGGMTLRSDDLYGIVIEGSYIIIVQNIGKVRTGGSAFVEGFIITAEDPSGGAVVEGAIDNPAVGIVANTPTGKARLQGSSDTEWAPEQGYQELGL